MNIRDTFVYVHACFYRDTTLRCRAIDFYSDYFAVFMRFCGLRSITSEPLVRWARNFAHRFGQQSSNHKQIFALLSSRIAELR